MKGRTLTRGVGALMVVLLLTSIARPLVITVPSGAWPADWPRSLEPLRKSARTIKVATGIQQNIYEITFSDRETFENVWPVILTLKTPGAPLTLYQLGSDPPKAWGELLSNAAPVVRIYAPTGSLIGDALGDAAETGRLDPQLVVRSILMGQMLKAGPPWPQSIVSPEGELPEFVVSRTIDGSMEWVDATQLEEEQAGFRYRARVDIELVVDGKVIDLNRIALPADTPVLDRRF